MAREVLLATGSVLNGNPITFDIKPNVIIGTDADKNKVYPSFHRVIVEVECGMSGGGYETIKLSTPVVREADTELLHVDVSSALRTFRDSYEYSPLPTTYPIVKFRLRVYDEFMLDGEVHTKDEIVYPGDINGEKQYFTTIFGSFSDFDRLSANAVTKGVRSLSRKPTSTPHLVAVGETFAYTPPYSAEQSLIASATLTKPESKTVGVTKEGQQTLGYQNVFALPASEAKKRQVFRFINSFGVLESISVPRVYQKTFGATSTPYAVARQETFNTFSRATIKKQNNRETWAFTTDPLTEEWLSWYLHEFLMSENIWIEVNGVWLPVTVTPDEELVFYDRTQQNMYAVQFKAQLDINGSPA